MLKKTVLTIGTVAIVTLGSAFATTSPTVYAQTSLQDVDKQKEDVSAKLSKAESNIADVLYEIEDINAEMERLESALDENNKALNKNKKKENALQDEIDQLNTKIEKRNDILKDRISSYQENGGSINYLEVFLGSKDFSDFISRMSAVSTMTNADADLIAENENDKVTVEKKLKKQEKVSQELEDQKGTIAAQKAQKKESKKALKEKEAKVKEEKSKLESKSSDLEALESEIRASMEEEANAQQAAAESSESSPANTNNNSSTPSASATPVASSSPSPSQSSSPSKSKKSPVKTNIAAPSGGGSAISAGKQFIGKSSYSYGAQNPSAGLFDCSGFVQWAYKQEGVSLPRTASAMGGVGQKVPYSQAQPGDLVIFRGGSHVGIYLGGGKFIGSQSNSGVAIADMNSGYWKQNFDNNVRRIN